MLSRATILLLAAAPACRAPGDGPAEVERARIVEVLRDQERAWNEGDLDRFMQGYLDSPEITFFSGSSVLRGHAALRERYRGRYASEGKEMGRLAFRDLRVDVLGPALAAATGRWRLETQAAENAGLFTLLLRKTGAGWRIIHDHTSQ